MKILHIIPSLNIGGAEVLVTKMAILARINGHEVKILVFKHFDNHLIQELSDAGVEIVIAPYDNYYTPLNVLFLIKYLRKYSVDIVHAHLTPAQLWISFASLVLKKSLILITSEHSTFNRRRKFFFKPLDWFIYARFVKIISISKETETELLKWLPSLQKKSVIINNGIDINEFSTININKKLSNKMLSVLCIGRLEEQKNQTVLIRAVALVNNVELFLVGDGNLREKLQRLTADLNITDRVHFLGNRADVAELIKMSDIYVQPSLWEGFGIATLEAMASGLPIIASNVTGLRDVVADAGLLVASDDVQQLANAIKRLANDEQLRSELSSRGIERAKRFSLMETFNKHLQLYNDLLKHA